MKKIKCKTNEGNFIEINQDEIILRPQIYAIILNNKNEILLCPNWDGYDFPGGGIDVGETNEEALEREIFEETGLKVISGKVFFVDSSMYFHPNKKKGFHTILMYAAAKIISGEISTKNLDIHEQDYAGKAEWISLEKIKDLKFYNSVDSVDLIKKVKYKFYE